MGGTQARDKVHGTMRPIDSLETGPGASNVPRAAEGAQRHNDYSLHYKWLKQKPASPQRQHRAVRRSRKDLQRPQHNPYALTFRTRLSLKDDERV